jgi:hypothetical protein
MPTPYSVPDDRVTPNSGTEVQGTETYTVPEYPSVTPPVDSRVSVPVDSRIAPNIPENSRTPGTYGPGE